MINKYIDNNFYCIDINFNSIWIALFSINSNKMIDIKFISKRSINNLLLDGKIDISNLEKEVKKVVSIVENEVDETVYSIYLTSGMLNISSQIRQIDMHIGENRQVTNKHIQKGLMLLKDDITFKKYEVLQIIPIKYNIDVGVVDNPVGYKTKDLSTTYNVITANSDLLKVIKNIFEKYQIVVNDIVSHNYLLSKFVLTDTELNLPTLLIDITINTININLIYDGLLIECHCIQNKNLVDEYKNKINIYNVMQSIKSTLPDRILNLVKSIVIYSFIKPDPNIMQTVYDVFGVSCKMLFSDSKNNSPIYYLIHYVYEQVINENEYFNISKKRLGILGMLKDIITETL